MQQQEAFEERNLDIRRLYGHVMSSRAQIVEHRFRTRWRLKSATWVKNNKKKDRRQTVYHSIPAIHLFEVFSLSAMQLHFPDFAPAVFRFKPFF